MNTHVQCNNIGKIKYLLCQTHFYMYNNNNN